MPHIHDKFDFTVSVFIVYNDKVLLVNHPRYGKWLPMGGHIELDEDPEQAVFREVKEETGLTVTILGTKPDFKKTDTKSIFAPRYVDVHQANPSHKHIGLVYFAQAADDKHVLSAEHTDINWLGLNDLDKPKYALTESLKFYCREAIAASAETR